MKQLSVALLVCILAIMPRPADAIWIWIQPLLCALPFFGWIELLCPVESMLPRTCRTISNTIFFSTGTTGTYIHTYEGEKQDFVMENPFAINFGAAFRKVDQFFGLDGVRQFVREVSVPSVPGEIFTLETNSDGLIVGGQGTYANGTSIGTLSLDYDGNENLVLYELRDAAQVATSRGVFSYDSQGNLESEDYGNDIDGDFVFRVAYQYDALNRVIARQTNFTFFILVGEVFQITFSFSGDTRTYNADGTENVRQLFSNGSGSPDRTETFEYNDAGQLTRIRLDTDLNGSIDAFILYSRDTEGFVTQIATQDVGGVTTVLRTIQHAVIPCP